MKWLEFDHLKRAKTLIQRHSDSRRLRRRHLHLYGDIPRPRRFTRTRQCYEPGNIIPWHYNRQALVLLPLQILNNNSYAHQNLIYSIIRNQCQKNEFLQGIKLKYHVSGVRLGGAKITVGLEIRRMEGEGTAELVPVVAARENPTEAEDDHKKKGSSQGKPEGRARAAGVGNRSVIRTLHE